MVDPHVPGRLANRDIPHGLDRRYRTSSAGNLGVRRREILHRQLLPHGSFARFQTNLSLQPKDITLEDAKDGKSCSR
jgi:hypothetical protein